MLLLFQLLFRKSYWQMLLRGASWREVWLSLRRAHKDRRARKHILQFGTMLIIPVLCLAYFAWLAGTGALLFVPFVVPVIWWRHRRDKRDSQPLHIAPTSKPVIKELTSLEKKAVRTFFSDTTLLYAVVHARAGSEAFLRAKVLPDGLEVVSRRTHIDLLQSKGMWERISTSDRQMIMMPDGHWDDAQIADANRAMEPVRLLRWLLRLDVFLPVIGMQLRGDYGLARELVEDPSRIYVGEDLLDISTARIGRDAASQFFMRCIAEAIHRGCYEVSDDSTVQWAREVSEELKGKQHDDLVLGDKLVSESSNLDLLVAIMLAKARRDFLTWTISILESGDVPSTLPSVFPQMAEAMSVQVE